MLPKLKNNTRRLWPYAAIVMASLLANWFIQFAYYTYMIRTNPSAFLGERTLLDYKTGYIGDLVVVPLMNAAILSMLLRLKPVFTRSHYVWLASCGLAADALLHFSQGFLRLINWSMPEPFDWDFVGYWHMISFFFQISFVFLFFYLAIQAHLRKDIATIRAMFVVFALIGVFISLFLVDYVPMHSAAAELAFQTHRVLQAL